MEIVYGLLIGMIFLIVLLIILVLVLFLIRPMNSSDNKRVKEDLQRIKGQIEDSGEVISEKPKTKKQID